MGSSNSIGSAASRPLSEVEGAFNRLANMQESNAVRANELSIKAAGVLRDVLHANDVAPDKGPSNGPSPVAAVPRTPLLQQIQDAMDREETTTRRLNDIESVLDRVVL